MQEPVKTAFSNDSETTALKIPPHSIEAEQAVLGGVFLDEEAWDKVAQLIREEDFYRKDHRIIFRAISNLCNEGKPCDIVTVSEWLESHQLLDDSGGMQNLAALAENTPSASNIVAYADIVRKRSVLRQLISATSSINNTIFNAEGKSSEQILETAEQIVFEIAEQEDRGRKGYQNISVYTDKVMEIMQVLAESKGAITGIPTGYHDLDSLTAGFQPSDLIIIAGRPAMGKTALAVNIAENAAIKDKRSVAIFSMEMSGEQLVMRMMCSLTNINQNKVKQGKLDGDDWERFRSTFGMLQETKIYIDDTPALSPAELRARCRRMSREHGLDLVVLDYLQLMQVPGSKENRNAEISEISRSLKAMAKELNIPVIALSQLNRSVDARTNKRPAMSDLRDSGSLEQDADVVIFIYREAEYEEHKDTADPGMAEILLRKQRNGPTGTVKLAWRGEYTRFDNYIPDPLSYDNPVVGNE
ncbi:MAG: replicative DNA helicase [Pseudomonadota bacterium]|nr:replicative DNA helicase [Pseudomonadota bacterium]